MNLGKRLLRPAFGGTRNDGVKIRMNAYANVRGTTVEVLSPMGDLHEAEANLFSSCTDWIKLGWILSMQRLCQRRGWQEPL